MFNKKKVTVVFSVTYSVLTFVPEGSVIMLKIFFIFYIGFCIFVPFQALGEGFCGPLAFGDLRLSSSTVRALNQLGVRDAEGLRNLDVEGLRMLSEEPLRDIYEKGVGTIIDKVGISRDKYVKGFNRSGVRPEANLLQLTERELMVILGYRPNRGEWRGKSRQEVINIIKDYLSSRGLSLARDFLVEDVGLTYGKADALGKAGIYTEADLLQIKEWELLNIHGMGKRTVVMIKIALKDRGKSLARDFLVEDVDLSVKQSGAFGEAGVRTPGDLFQWTERKLSVFLVGTMEQKDVITKIKRYLSSRGWSLAHDFLVDAVGLSFQAAGILNIRKIYNEADLFQLTERELESMRNTRRGRIKRKEIDGIKDYLSARGQSLARDFLVEDVGLSVDVANIFNRKGVRTVEDLSEKTEYELLHVMFGKVGDLDKREAVQKIQGYLASIGQSLAQVH